MPAFDLLGAPEERMRLRRCDGGHLPNDMNAVVREALAWLDRWSGPVETRPRTVAGG